MKELNNLVAKLLVIGSKSHEKVDSINWTQPFPDMENYDTLIVDLTQFPKDYPPTLFNNIGVLKRTARIFIRDNKEIFCIMSRPFRVGFKKIPLNFAWIPFAQKLRLNPMLIGITKRVSDERFAEYMEHVKRWDNEVFWEDTANCSFEPIAVNNSQNMIAATLTINGRGKIHFLPKATKISRSEAIDVLVGLATGEELEEHGWLSSVDVPLLPQTEDPWNSSFAPEEYRNLFSVDPKKFVKAVQLILEDLGVQTLLTGDFDLVGLKSSIVVKTASMKGKVEAHHPKVSQVTKFVEKAGGNEKVVFVANTYRDLPIGERVNRRHIDLPTKMLMETNNAMFLTALSLYNLWKKAVTHQISTQEATFLLHNEKGEITI